MPLTNRVTVARVAREEVALPLARSSTHPSVSNRSFSRWTNSAASSLILKRPDVAVQERDAPPLRPGATIHGGKFEAFGLSRATCRWNSMSV